MMTENASGADNQQERPITKQPLLWESSETTRQISQFDRSLATLLGLLYTDGCVSPKEKNSWRIYFCVSSLKLRDIFKKSILDVFAIPSNRVLLGKTKDGYYKAIVNSKEIGNFLVSNFGCFRTLKYENGSLPNVHLRASSAITVKCVPDFLRAAFTCDGGVSFYPVRQGKRQWLNRCVFLACAHPLLRVDYCTLLDILGLSFKNDPKDGKIRITTRSQFEEFYEKIGFLKDVTATCHSSNWRNYPKNKILECLLDSYKNPSKYLNSLR